MATNENENLSSVLASLVGQLDKTATGLSDNFETLHQTANTIAASSAAPVLPASNSAPSNSSGGSALLDIVNPINTKGPTSFLSSLVLGPIWRGLFSLFGGGDEKTEPALNPFIAPARALTQIDARIGPNQETSSLRTDSLGSTRASAAPSPTVQVSIQALDARSILDRSDEIASAVRQAMLSNHSINESFTEL